ncbi:hypothetical protein [Burkholderia stagnalis]|uniref:hypothetical protein n=1 Tax=Burkholderia stagnalis TaxID=1503054 RepID=UPI000752A184|nr:hypothetical protein [Burkholderia stagnalis]KVM88355.1 hypothetical protein WT05_07280 [Burkholderia stagnalis]
MVDYATPDGARHLLEHVDYFVRQRFVDALEPQLDELADALAACFKWVQPVLDSAAAVPAARTDLLKVFVLGGLDDLVVSSKLLLAGKLAASGNVARQAIEGIAMATLCSTEQPLVITQDRTKGTIRAVYWQQVMKQDRRVQGQHAVRQLGWNGDFLRLPQGVIASLAASQKRFSSMSHAGIEAIMLRTTAVGQGPPCAIEFGGRFESRREPLYRIEMTQRIGMCRLLEVLMEYFRNTMTASGAQGAASNQLVPA